MSNPPQNYSERKFSELIPRFLLTCRAEYKFSLETQAKYGECLRQWLKFSQDKPISEYTSDDLLLYEASLMDRKLSLSRQFVLIFALKRFLSYCQDKLGLQGIDPEKIDPPTREHRDVVFLTVEEVERFVASIPLIGYRGQPLVANLRFRALVETLLGSAMRISEALSLDRDGIDFKQREAKIIGKGNKERTVFFTARALYWIEKYLAVRADDHKALFVNQQRRGRLKRDDVWRSFMRFRKRAGIAKKVTPHILRHTAATLLMFNGCPMSHIKEILGHRRLETTCRHYLGLDKSAAKAAHQKYLTL